MNSLIDYSQNLDNHNQHLELGFEKHSLNTTCISKYSPLEQKIDSTFKQSAPTIANKNNQNLNQQPQKLKPNLKQQGLNKKSRCFINQISKVLKKNKIKNSQRPIPKDLHHLKKNYFNFDTQLSTVRYSTDFCSKGAKTNSEISKLITNDRQNKELFNFQNFFQNQIRKSQDIFKLRFEQRKAPTPKRKNQQKIKTVFICDTRQNGQINKSELKNTKISDKQNFHELQCSKRSNQKSPQSEQPTFKNFFEEPDKIHVKDKSIFGIETVKSSRVISLKHSRRKDIERQNKMENSKLYRSLKRAMSNLSLKQSHVSSSKKISIKSKRQDSNIIQDEPLNHAQITQKIHYDKLRSKVMSKMEDYKKINQIRQNDQKTKKILQKKRTFSAQPKLILTVEGSNLTLNKHDDQPSNFKGKDFKHRKPFTALSRTGLEHDRRQHYRRRASETQRKQTCLAGIKNSANHYRTYSKNSIREVLELDECKSDRIVRKLREKYNKRPKTARPSNSKLRTSIDQVKSEIRKSEGWQTQFVKRNIGKVTKKLIEKEKIKEKLLGLLVECQEEKIGSQSLKQGLDIFEDYCDNIDEGLKTITHQIDQFVRQQD